MEETSPDMMTSPLGQGTSKSKLDSLSKEDLIKFAKKQILAMQKMKSRCTDLEKEVEVLRQPEHDTLIQELRKRMDDLLLEKAETCQSLSSLIKEHEELKRQAHETMENLVALQEELHVKNKECAAQQTNIAELVANLQNTCQDYESKILQYQTELKETKKQFTAEMDSQQTSLTKSQQEMENLQQEILRLNRQYEDDVRELEEQMEMNTADFEKERERLLLIHDELAEQLALKEGFLQDVQEEEEYSASTTAIVVKDDSGLTNMPVSLASDDSDDKAALLRSTLEDLQSQTVMFQEEITFLRNVKLELESELKQVKDEFTMEREELEFRINELQMNKDEGNKRCSVSIENHHYHQNIQSLHETHSQDVKPELEHQETRSVCTSPNGGQTGPDEILREKAELFVKQYQLNKRQIEASVQTLQETLFKKRDQPSELTEEYIKMSFDEIILQLQHKDALVEEFTLDRGVNTVPQLDDQLRMISREKQESIKIPEEDICALQSRDEEHQEYIKHLTSQISHLSEAKDVLQRHMNVNQNQLSEALSHITEILQQKYSETEVDVTSDISTLIDRLMTKAEEERNMIVQQVDERAQWFAVELENTRRLDGEQMSELREHLKDISQEKEMLKASLHDMLLDTEALQKDLREVQAMNENLRGENQTLLTQITDLRKTLEEKPHEGHISATNDTEVSDSTELQQSLAEKDTLISQLKEEISHLQVSVPDEDVKVSHKIEILEKEMKEKDERMNKIKAVAVKAKKELDNSKKEVVALSEEVGMLKDERDKLSRSMKDIIHGAEDYKNLIMEYDKLSELLEKEKEKLEQMEKLNEDLSRRLENTSQQHELVLSEREDLMVKVDTLQSNVTQLQSHILEIQKNNGGLEKQLEAERLVKEQKTKDHQSAVRDVEELQSQLSKLKHQLQNTDHELEQLRKDAQQSSLMDMEMADYEKLVRELNHKLCERDRQIQEYQTQEETQKEREQRLNEDINSLKVMLDQTEEKASKMKQLLVKTKKELGDAKQKEAEHTLIQSSLRGDLETHQQQLEEYKIQCSDLTAEKHRLEEQMKMMNDQQQRSSSSYQIKLNVLQDQCTAAKAELAATVSEFESYKVRVHNVLKQQKHKSSKQSDEDSFRQEREHMDSVLERLRRQLQETQQMLQSSTAELQQLQTEHDAVLERHNKILQESVTKEAELRERVLTLQSENVSLKSEHGQCNAHLNAQTDALRNSFREQVRQLQDEHCITVETLQQQISRLETQLFHMQKESSSNGPVVVSSRKCQVDRKFVDVPQFDLQGVAREDGEGMETTETESMSSSRTQLASLEHLLTAPDPKHEPVVWQMELSKEELTQKLNTANRSMEHLNGLLHETEATNAVLMEQITLLKSEVRRLERNQEREKSVANLEYLKNVLLQFIFLRSGSERQALLPVIHTMLQLSPEEKNKLSAIAQGEEETVVSRASGWTSYLHSWSGIR